MSLELYRVTRLLCLQLLENECDIVPCISEAVVQKLRKHAALTCSLDEGANSLEETGVFLPSYICIM